MITSGPISTRFFGKILGFVFGAVLFGVLVEIFSKEMWALIQQHYLPIAGFIGTIVFLYVFAFLNERGFLGPSPHDRIAFYRQYIPRDFVQPLASASGSQAFSEKIESKLFPFALKWLASRDAQRARWLAVLGEYGTGKTTFCFYLAHRLSMSWLWAKRYKIKLIQFGRDDFEAAMQSMKLGERRQTFLILDAFDEDPEAIRDYRKRWREIAAHLNDFPKVLLTSRIEFFADEATDIFDADTSGGPVRIDQKDFQKVFISFYNPRQIRKVWRKKSGRWPFSIWRAAKKYRRIKNRPTLFDIARRPVFLAYLNGEGLEKLATQENIADAVIYNLITESFLTQRPGKTGRKELRLRPEAGIPILSALGFYLMTHAETHRQIAVSQLPKLVKELSKKIGLAQIQEFERFAAQIRSQPFLQKRGEGVYAFSHRSFTEYFAARFVVDFSPKFYEPLPALMRDRQVMAFANQIIREQERRRFNPQPPPGMVYIPGGFFIMGSEKEYESERPVNLVRVKGFYMGQYPVTQEEWEKVMGSNPSRFKGSRRSVENVSWNDCQEYMKKLSSRELAFRLPTEAEWEYVCRADAATEYFFGDDPKELARYAWFKGNSKGSTHPVGEKQPNPWGLYDVLGNVWEWCSSLYKPYPYDEKDGRENSRATEPRVLRGGAFYGDHWLARSAYRGWNDPHFRNYDVGFRVVVRPLL